MGLRTMALLAALLAALSLVALPAVSAAAGGAPVNTAAPVITYPDGTPPVVGDTLAVSTGTWSNAPTSFSYQWSAGATPITGATQATYTISAADLGSSGAVRFTVVVTATNGSGATSAIASSQTVVVGAQHGDVMVVGDGVNPGFSYNARPIPPACINGGFNPPGDPDPFCSYSPYSNFFSIDSANANGTVTLTDTVAGSTGLEFSFYEPAGNQNSAQAYFTSKSHGYQYPGAFFGGQSVGQLGLQVFDCNAGAPCTINFDLRDVYGYFEGSSYVYIEVQTLTSNGYAGSGYVYIPLAPTAPPPTAGFTWNGAGSNSFNFISTSAATSPATITGYSWDFGDGTTSTAGPTVTHAYTSQATSRTVSLTVTDSNGAQATSTQTMGPDLVVSDVVSTPPSPDPGQAASMAVTVRNDGPATVTGVAPTVIFADPSITVGSPAPASVDLGPGDSTTFTVAYSAPAPGKFQAQVKAAGSTGGSTVTSTPVTRTITVGVAVIATLTPSTANPVAGTPFSLDLHIANNSGHAQGFALGAPTANPSSGVSLTAPTSSPANLADGQSEDLTYTAVVSQAGPVTVTTPVVATDLTTLATTQLGPQTDLTVSAPLTVVSSTSDSDHGPITGGYAMTITGTGLTGATAVAFFVGGAQVKTVSIPTSTSDTTIGLTAPDLSSLVGSIPSGSNTLSVDVVVGKPGPGPTGSVVLGNGPFSFNLPSISSVTATATGNSHGSIVGGYQLTIEGKDLTGVDSVVFGLGANVVKTLLITPSTSDTTIEVTAPDLSSLVGSIPAGSNSLGINVVALITDANAPNGAVVSDPSSFGFDIPAIATVLATATGSTHGSIIGGYQLTIEGKDLTGIDTVILALDGARVKTLAITPSTSDTTIEVTAPDLSSLAGSIPSGSNTLPIDVIVQTNDANAPGGVIASNQVPFDFNVPTVSSVTATDTGAAHGGIAGGYQLTITGADLAGVDQVTFTPPPNNLPTVGTQVIDLPSPSTSDTTIVVTAPDESALASLITSGSHSLPVGVKVAITDGTGPGGAVLFETPPTTFEFDVPTVSSVTATATGATHGGIVGGYQLTVSGSDLGGVTQVAFLDGADQVKTITLPGPSASNTSIQVTAPDLSALITSIPAGGHSLPIGVEVAIADGSNPGGPPLFQSPPTTFGFNVPSVTSVTATATGATHGSIVGGYQLTITGSDLAGVDQVEFDPPANNLTTVPTVGNLVIDLPSPSTSDTTISLTAPDESALASLAASEQDVVPVGVKVGITDGSGPGAPLLFESPPTTFSFNLPNFTSVRALTTGTARGSITGGYAITITGTDLTGVTKVQFFNGTEVVKTVALAAPSASDTTITMVVPDLATLVGSIAPGAVSLPLFLAGVIPDPSDPNNPASDVEGGIAGFTVTEPTLALVAATDGTDTTPITGGDSLSLTGSGLVGVNTAAFFLGGDRVKTVSIPVSNVDAYADVLATPDLGSLVGSIPAGSSELPIEIEVAIADPLAPGGYVESNPIPIGFVLPQIDSLSASTTGGAHGSLSGGYTVTAHGHDLGAVTTVAFERDGESLTGVSVESGGATASGSDTSVTFTAPNLSSLLESLPSGATSLPVDLSFGSPDPTAPLTGVFSLPVTFGLDLAPPDCGALVDCVGGVNTDPAGTATASSTSGTGTISATGSGVGGVTVGRYTSDPVGTAAFEIAGSYFDVRSSTPEAFTSVTIVNCDLAGGTAIHWWNPSGGTDGSGAWAAVSNQSYSAGPPACVTVTIGSTTSPSLAELTGTVFAASIPTPAANTGTGAGNGTGTSGTPASGGTLAFTGGGVRRLFELSVLLVVSGAFLTRRARRPRRAHRASRRSR